MDYCSSCRRHLNGALVCPGCGAYAPDIAPRPAVGPTAAGTADAPAAPTAAWETALSGSWHDGDLPDGDMARTDLEWTPDAGPHGDIDDAPDAPQGRAARRRQLARWKKNKRRAAVATAVAIVGGGLTVASMNRQSVDRTQTTAAPDNRAMGVAEREATDTPDPASTPATPDGAAPGTSFARQAATVLPRKHTQTVATTPRKTLPLVQADSAAAGGAKKAASTPRTTDSTVTNAGGTTPGSADSSGTAVEEATTPASTPPPSGASDSGTDSGTGSGTSQSSGSTQDTSSQQKLCLLVICLG
jgi:hypothetical protein